MILYHGSNTAIDKIDLSKSKVSKDFGCGFYLSNSLQQAQEMAHFKALTLGGDEIVTAFDFREECMTDGSLKVMRFEDYSVEWAMFVIENRKNATRTQVYDYDIVYGPIADDRVGPQIRRLENGDIDMHTFLERVKYMKGITFQYFFGTEKSLQNLIRR